MKKFLFTFGLFCAMGLTYPVMAQSISINVNLDKQPSWGPTGYDYASSYFFPDINIYFDVNNSLFYYLSGSQWISNRYLPDKYSKYDLYSMYKVVVNEQQPWLQNKSHKKQYAVYKGNKTQEAIRYSSNSKYNNSKNNNQSWVDNSNLGNRNKGNNNNNSNSNKNNNNSKNNSNKNQSGGKNQSSGTSGNR